PAWLATSARSRSSRLRGRCGMPWPNPCLTPASRLGGTRVTDGQHLPHVAVRLVPVDVAVRWIDLHIHRSVHRAAVLDSSRLDAAEDGVEFLAAHAKAEVVDGKVLVRILEVERQPLVDINGGKRTGRRF